MTWEAVDTVLRRLRIATATSVCVLGFACPASSAQASFTVLHAFTGGQGDCTPAAEVVLDKAGNLYGTTAGGFCNGASWVGTVYKLTPAGSEKVLYVFTEGSGGYLPNGLLIDKRGNLWGQQGREGLTAMA